MLPRLIMRISLNSGAVLLAFYLPIVAAEDFEALPQIVVNPLPESSPVSVGSSEFLDEKDVTRMQQRSVSDVLQGTPGYSFSRLGGIGATGVTLLRGAGGQGIMTLDDIPILESIPGSHLTDSLPSEAIDHAEIRRGPAQSYYPFQALGGTIRLYTHDQDETGGKVSVEGGSFGLLRETLQAGVAGQPGRATMTLTRADAFDGSHFANASHNPEHDPFRYTQGIVRFTSFLGSKTQWEGSLLYRNSTAGVDKFGLSGSGLVVTQDDANSFRREETWLAQNKLIAQFTDAWQSQLQMGYTQSRTFVNLGSLQNAVFSRLYLVNWRNQQLLFGDDKGHQHWQLNWGGQGRYEQGASPFAEIEQNRTSEAGFADLEFKYQNLNAEAGVRVEHFNRYGTHPLFQTGLNWRIRSDLTFKASGGSGYRLPAYSELFFLFFGNPALKPERSASGELGFEWSPIDHLKLAATGFYNHYQDLISVAYSPIPDFPPFPPNSPYDPHPANGPVSANVANARVAGMEFSGQYDWINDLAIGCNYTYSDSRDMNTNKLLPLRPRHSVKFWQEWHPSKWPLTLRVETIYRNSTWNDFDNQFPVKDSVQINAFLRYRITSSFEAYLRGENLSDNRHSYVFSYDTPGVAVYGGFSKQF